MSNLRKYERAMVKHQAVLEGKSFETAWDEHREKKYVIKDEEGKVLSDKTPRSNQKKKQVHYDDKRQYFNMFNWMKNMRQKREEDKQ